MNHYRRVFEDMPDSVAVPPELRHRRVELILLPLDETLDNHEQAEGQGWSNDFFTQTAGCWAGDPIVRESPDDYETREELE
jgi:hypothetical protein